MEDLANSHMLTWELVELATHLRQEKLFISSEQSQLIQLNDEVGHLSEKLLQLSWVTWQQRMCTKKLVSGRPGTECTPLSCLNHVVSLDDTKFVEAHTILGYTESNRWLQLLDYLKLHPDLLAKCLATDNQDLECDITSVIIPGLYASCLLPEDETLFLKLLFHLINLQIATSEDPRRLLRHSSCAFVRLYSSLNEGIYPARLFLTAALHNPIMLLVMRDEKFLDIDPEKALIRFAPAERLRMFGVEGSNEYTTRLSNYRSWTINNLVSLSNVFVKSIQNNVHCFPNCVSSVVRHIYNSLITKDKLQRKEVLALCVDLVFTSFICPPLINPEQYGIVDVAISYVARFNLIQVAKILHMLAMRKYEPVEPKVADLYNHFDKNCLDGLMNIIVGDENDRKYVHHYERDMYEDRTAVKTSKCIQSYTALLTHQQLNDFATNLQTVHNDLDISVNQRSRFGELISSAVSSLSSKAGAVATSSSSRDLDHQEVNNKSNQQQTVLIFQPSQDTVDSLRIGFLSEQEVLDQEETNCSRRDESKTSDSTRTTHYSVSQSNDEAASEAGVSNQSEDSSIELEDQNDNLSDMISANVSGRGSPNLSGRDTPSSHVAENDETVSGNGNGNVEQAAVAQSPPAVVTKPIRFDLDDKFGKFEIKGFPHAGDETVSLVSDTWSTDVVSSDCDMLEHQANANLHIYPPASFSQLLEISETTSEGWSTDVVVSDSDRVTEGDTDDAASIAPSDVTTETTRSEVESRGEPETCDDGIVDTGVTTVAEESTVKSNRWINQQQLRSLSDEKRDDSSSLSSSIEERCALEIQNDTTATPTAKSIRFDKTAEKTDKDTHGQDEKRTGFFRNFKIPFKSRMKGKPENSNLTNFYSNGISSSVTYTVSEQENDAVKLQKTKTSEEILSKYRSKVTRNNSDEDKCEQHGEQTMTNSNNHEFDDSICSQQVISFENIKKKLRIVLSNTQVEHIISCTNNNNQLPTMGEGCCYMGENVVVSFLQLQLAEGINVRDRSLTTHIEETLRCIRSYDNNRCYKLLESLKEEYRARSAYMSYLMRSRQTLLWKLAYITRLSQRLRREQSVCKELLCVLLVRLFMQKREQQIQQLVYEFQRHVLPDEQKDIFQRFKDNILSQIASESFSTSGQLDEKNVMRCVERAVFSRIYYYAMFPNGDGDISRDQVLQEHISKLCQVVTPDHPDLRIPKKFHQECPWPSAQSEISEMVAHKTPADKFQCVLRCTQCIVNLLQLACDRTTPSADHLVPILVYVIIKANPPSLLSTVQYISNFCGDGLQGEDHYWWVQFCSSVEFIKTMDYNTC